GGARAGRAEASAGTRRDHRARGRARIPPPARGGDGARRAGGRAAGAGDPRPRPLRGAEREVRPRHRRPGAGRVGAGPEAGVARGRLRGAPRRRHVRRPAARLRPGTGAAPGRTPAPRARAAPLPAGGPDQRRGGRRRLAAGRHGAHGTPVRGRARARPREERRTAPHGRERSVAQPLTGLKEGRRMALERAPDRESGPGTAAVAAPGAGTPPARVLVVGGDGTAAEARREVLSDEPVQVAIAATAEEAMRLITAACPDLILTDISLPGKSGIELMRQAREIDPEVAVVLMTGHASMQTAIDALRQGASDYVT